MVLLELISGGQGYSESFTTKEILDLRVCLRVQTKCDDEDRQVSNDNTIVGVVNRMGLRLPSAS